MSGDAGGSRGRATGMAGVVWALLTAALLIGGVLPTARAAAIEPSAGARPDKEETYTITSVLQVLQPVNPADMNDDFQECRVLSHDQDSYTVEVTYYPLCRQKVEANANWRADDAGMTAYLKPTLTENWDEAMKEDLLAQLKLAGIEPEQLTDKQLVEQVSKWAMARARTTDAFGICPDAPRAVIWRVGIVSRGAWAATRASIPSWLGALRIWRSWKLRSGRSPMSPSEPVRSSGTSCRHSSA